ncbi:Leucine-responsive regulatory protein [Thalassovita gelatinovora]|uniref:Leucine-responsive regulatory protein n=1 Tax=Thalassovita gelatinovora TaxID=53501 RepID=A0A0P1F8E2_THAGE|nr:Lrp/AsnC family transcriptional regulator [Thalassovita gelatinovora]QIZ80154.1 Lrp/AsnC family transcriptional regulator [Thalassovita gelatinovora]CUH63949.1 Leucine-responsive regulatory protein [Thalassovita gelatinovora]SEQ80520.1 transcriptional regulator, AsnC family [Thalassovita gelatinovora]
MLDSTDRKICALLQNNARASSTEVAQAVALSVSAANERIRRLATTGAIAGWRAVLAPDQFDANLCAFALIDLDYDGEAEAVAALCARDEVQELHHISGPHSYLMKLRLADTKALNDFLNNVVKPLPAVSRTETIITLDTAKETSAIAISEGAND